MNCPLINPITQLSKYQLDYSLLSTESELFPAISVYFRHQALDKTAPSIEKYGHTSEKP